MLILSARRISERMKYMAGQVETDITLYTKTELQEIQNNSHSGSVNDSKGNVQSILSAIVTYTSAAA